MLASDLTVDATHPKQGHLQVAHLIDRIETSIRDGKPLEPLITEFLGSEPAHIAAVLIKWLASKRSRPGIFRC